MKSREGGFYWVMISSRWMIALWDENTKLFYLTGKYGGLTPDYIERIDENRITR